MERYLEGEVISHEEIVTALKEGTNHGGIFPVVCGVATRNLGTNRLLDAIVEDLPSPVKHGGLKLPDITLEPDPDKELFAYVFKTKADQFAGRINFFRVYQGAMAPDRQVLNTRAHAKERIGTLIVPQGREQAHADGFGPGDIGAVAKLKETRAGDWLAERDEPIVMPRDQAARSRSWPSRSRPAATRTRSSPRCAACRRRTRRSTCTATPRPASRSSPASRRCTSR